MRISKAHNDEDNKAKELASRNKHNDDRSTQYQQKQNLQNALFKEAAAIEKRNHIEDAIRL